MQRAPPTQDPPVPVSETCSLLLNDLEVSLSCKNESLNVGNLTCEPLNHGVRPAQYASFHTSYNHIFYYTMESYEVRIHYAANNMVSEDARWMKVAQGMAGFRPARRLRLSDTIVDASSLTAQNLDNQCPVYGPTQPINISSGSNSTSKSRDSSIALRNVTIEASALNARKRRTNISFEELSPRKHKRTKRTSFARTKKGLNPEFRSPIVGYLKSRKVHRPSVDTPKACVESDSIVLVPVTESPRRPQRPSNTTYTEQDPGLTRSQDQPTPDFVNETSFTDHSASLADSSKPKTSAVNQEHASSRSFGVRSYPCNQEQLRLRNQNDRHLMTDGSGSSSCSFQTSFEDNEIGLGTQVAQPAHDDSRDTPAATTATPSDHGGYILASSPLAQKGNSSHDTVIDLTTSPDYNTLAMTRRDVLGPVSSPVGQHQETTFCRDGAVRSRQREFLKLPRKAMCKATCTARSRGFESFVPRYLLDLAERFELLNQFRPVSAPALIQNSERGYWNLRIKVSDAAVVTEARRPPLTSSQWSDQRFMLRQEGVLPASVSTEEGNNALRQSVYPNKNPVTYTPWTIDELKTFWAYLRKVIERGQAGYDVHATLKRRESAAEDLDVEVKLYGYAESLSHLWLLLYGVSSTLTANMPLQWCIPGTGPVVTMSGQLKCGGKLGRWVPRGTGISGSWALEDSWDGLSSAMNVAGTTGHNQS